MNAQVKTREPRPKYRDPQRPKCPNCGNDFFAPVVREVSKGRFKRVATVCDRCGMEM